ncbi:MAG: bifunctional adenosylcobinamide kinase/adenosylcobinamide-phosphate guanylyltransferase [Eubacteriales bacterium]|nr:bifunctional adenosylcobinamide kinase/adenosylcobinamide-phosphate guanylyltransferase [Eubacteriales bacterium]
MFWVVTGGSGSGKSAYAEQKIMELGNRKRYYVATMECMDEESKNRIKRHRNMRAGKQFETLECPRNLDKVVLKEKESAVLLECMSNLCANEFFDGKGHTPAETADKILHGLENILGQCGHLVVVTNEIFSDAADLDEYSLKYLECLGMINSRMAKYADGFIEVVYGIPIVHKKEKECML